MNDEVEKSATEVELEGAEIADGAPESQSFARIAYRQLVRNRLALLGFAMVCIVATVAAFVPFLANDKPLVIHCTMPDDYEAAYYSVLDAAEQIAAILPWTVDTLPQVLEDWEVLLRNIERMQTQLGGEDREDLKELRSRTTMLEAPPEGVRGMWVKWRDEFEARFAVDQTSLVPRYYFPLIRTLRPIELFFIVLWFAAVIQWIIRRRSPPTWRRAGRVALLAAALSIAWNLAVPDRVYPTGYFKKRLAEASFALMPPVPYGETESIETDRMAPPTWTLPAQERGGNYHFLGTDLIGRDVMSRMVYGARIAMVIGFVAVSIYVTIGIIVGAFAGYFRGSVDIIVSRVIEIVICFPVLFLILIVLAMLRPSIINIMVVIGLTWWTGVARLTRGEFFRIVNLDYVSAVQALGGSSFRIIFRHILPNGIGPILVVASFGIASAILVESALSFLGFGVPQPFASWGTLLNEGRDNIQGTWWLTVFPGIAIFVTVTAWNLFGEGLRDAIDPRMKQ